MISVSSQTKWTDRGWYDRPFMLPIDFKFHKGYNIRLDEHLIRGDAMSIDLEVNTKNLQVSCIISPVVELFSAVQALAEPTHHEFLNLWIIKVLDSLSENSKNLLQKIANFQLHGMELYQFILDLTIYDDIEQFIDQLILYTDIRFVSVFTDECINKNNYDQLVNHELEVKIIEEKFPWLFKDSLHELDCIIFDTTNFKIQFCALLKEISQLVHFKEHLESVALDFEDANKNLLVKLKTKRPLDLAQELMGKKFGRIFDYKTYLFCPSYFISPHKLRLHNESINLIIYDIRNNSIAINQVGEEISNTLKVISDRTRLEILRRLYKGRTYGKLLANSLDLTTATISHHLEQLKSVGLVTEERVKNTKYFSINEEKFKRLLTLTDDYIHDKN